MKTLYLLRHANAAAATLPQMSDYDRTLSALGVREARAVGRFMKSNRMHPDFILSSSAIRTTQTAQIVIETLQTKIANTSDKELYQASDEKILSEIQKTDPAQRSILVVSHNPGIAELAYALGRIPHYAPATLSVFTADCDIWAEFLPGKVKLQKVFVPEG